MDMGAGSGILALTSAKKKNVQKILAVDKNKAAVRLCNANAVHKKIAYRYSNLFSSIKGTFDTIIFNPPYLPTEPRAMDMALDGGKQGHELLERFLKQAGKHLKENGVILILFSSLTDKGKIDQILLENLFLYQELARQHVFFEDLYVYRIWKHPAQSLLARNKVTKPAFFTKGKRGMIFTGTWKGKKVAIKLQLPGIAVKTIAHEYRMLKMLNRYGIGPQVFWSKGNMMVYKFIDGLFFPLFAAKAGRQMIRNVLADVFQQCGKLDQLGFTKQEMHHPVKHIVVTKKGKAVLLDFERCRKTKKQKNVTQFCQYVSSPHVQRLLERKKISINPREMRTAAQQYKKDPSKETLGNILSLIR